MHPTTILTENKLIAVGQTRNIEYVPIPNRLQSNGKRIESKKKKKS